MLSGSDVSRVTEHDPTLDKAPDRDSLLDGIDKSLEDTEDSNKSLTDQEGSIQNLPPSTGMAVQSRSTDLPAREVFTRITSDGTATAQATGQGGGVASPHSHPPLRGHSLPATSQDRRQGCEGGDPHSSHQPPPPAPPHHNSHQGKQPPAGSREGGQVRGAFPGGVPHSPPPNTTGPQQASRNYTKHTSAQERIHTGHTQESLGDPHRRTSRGRKGGVPRTPGHPRTADVSV